MDKIVLLFLLFNPLSKYHHHNWINLQCINRDQFIR